MGPAPGQPGFRESGSMTGGEVFAAAERLRSLLPEYRARPQRALDLANDMLEALGPDRSLPGAALTRRAAYQRLMVDWLAETIERVPVSSGRQRARGSAPARARSAP